MTSSDVAPVGTDQGPPAPEVEQTTLRAAMARAVEAAADPAIRPGANPRVGCVLLDAEGRVGAVGVHRGAGTPHAEVDALTRWTRSTAPHTAVVTLEPCRHTGRTGPCTEALVKAGLRRVVVGVRDPDPVAGGGLHQLLAAGLDVVEGVGSAEAAALDPEWLAAARLGRPHVTWKVGASLDGRVAAADGTSRWITSPEARADAHRLRARSDAVLVGVRTVLVDGCRLTVRDADGTPAPPDRQPLRVVLGRSAVPEDAAVLDDTAPTMVLGEHDPHAVLRRLWVEGVRRVLLEGGPTVAAAFLGAGVVDRLVVYLAPTLLGAGPSLVGDLGGRTLSQASRLRFVETVPIGPDVRLVAELTEPR